MRGHIIAHTGVPGCGKNMAALGRTRKLINDRPGLSIHLLQSGEGCPPFAGDAPHRRYEQILWQFSDRLCREIELLSRFDVVVTDGTLLEAAAMAIHGGPGAIFLSDPMIQMARHHMHRYQEIHFYTLAGAGRPGSHAGKKGQMEETLFAIYGRLGLDENAPGFYLH